MSKLSDTQTILLSHAAQRASGSLYPLPPTIAAPPAAVTKSIAALVNRGLAEERETSDADAVVRSDGDLRCGVYITAAGLAAIGIAPTDGEGGVRTTANRTRKSAARAGDTPASTAGATLIARPTKSGTVIALLQRPNGSTLAELIAATSWLPHTTRAALTGLRKKGHTIERSKRDGATCYRIATAA